MDTSRPNGREHDCLDTHTLNGRLPIIAEPRPENDRRGVLLFTGLDTGNRPRHYGRMSDASLKSLIGPALFAASAIGALWLVFQMPSAPEPEQPEQTQEQKDIATARYACRVHIEDILHDPSSAEWGTVGTWPAGIQTGNPDRILVQPEIRARNAMRATILTRFQCTFIGSGDTLSLVDLTEY